MTLLSDTDIIRHLDTGAVVIDPFLPERLNTDSYDLELGPWFWRYERMLNRRPANMERGRGFELVDAREAGGIWLASGERVLGHSVEVVGGTVVAASVVDRQMSFVPETVAVTTHLQATSTAGRHGLSACMCAGYGDVGFVNIWTLEISNLTEDRMFVPVGAVICQIAFTRVTPPRSTYQDKTGNYAPTFVSAENVRGLWTPRDMLPKPLKVRDTWEECEW